MSWITPALVLALAIVIWLTRRLRQAERRAGALAAEAAGRARVAEIIAHAGGAEVPQRRRRLYVVKGLTTFASARTSFLEQIRRRPGHVMAAAASMAAISLIPGELARDYPEWPDAPSAHGPELREPAPPKPTSAPSHRPPTVTREPTSTASAIRDGPDARRGPDPPAEGPDQAETTTLPPGNASIPTPTVPPTEDPTQTPTPTVPTSVTPTATDPPPPSPTPTRTPSPIPTPTPTPSPTEAPPRCLVHLDAPELLELCVLGTI